MSTLWTVNSPCNDDGRRTALMLSYVRNEQAVSRVLGALVCSRHAADREPANKQGRETVEEQSLPGMPVLDVRPDKGRDDYRSDSVEIMHGRRPVLAGDEENAAHEALDDDKRLADRERSGDAARKHLPSRKAEEPPEPDGAHEEHDGGGEAVMEEQHG